MKKALFLLACILALHGVYAAPIPVIDLTRQGDPAAEQAPPAAAYQSGYSSAQTYSHPPSYPSQPSYQGYLPQPLAQAPAQPLQQLQPLPPPQQGQAPLAAPEAGASALAANPGNPAQPQSRTLRLFLRELSVLQQAARAAGGDIKVSITPVGITAEDMIAPLTQMNWFDIHPEGDLIVIKSRTEDPYLKQVHDEIAQLEKRRRVLMGDVQTLEQVASRPQQTASQDLPATAYPTYYSQPAPQAQMPQGQSRLPVGAQASPQQQGVEALYDRVSYAGSANSYNRPQSAQSQAVYPPPAASYPTAQAQQAPASEPVIETSPTAASSASALDLQRAINPPESLPASYLPEDAAQSAARDVPPTLLPSSPTQASSPAAPPTTQTW